MVTFLLCVACLWVGFFANPGRTASENRPRQSIHIALIPECAGSECDPQAAVDHAPVERGPGVHGPTAVGRARGPHQRFVARLPDVSEILGVYEEADSSEAALEERAEKEVASPCDAERVFLERLPGGVVKLDPEAPAVLVFPDCVQARLISRRQRHLAPPGPLRVFFCGARVGVCGKEQETLDPVTDKELRAESADGASRVGDLDRTGTGDAALERIVHAPAEAGRDDLGWPARPAPVERRAAGAFGGHVAKRTQ